mmetsp:Transcript_24192/g.80393  ORF Transcript_24192/g.80393 Transcript_24192/m.80393 type:complete len:400 (-) Transcript_24192:327-1526(-)
MAVFGRSPAAGSVGSSWRSWCTTGAVKKAGSFDVIICRAQKTHASIERHWPAGSAPKAGSRCCSAPYTSSMHAVEESTLHASVSTSPTAYRKRRKSSAWSAGQLSDSEGNSTRERSACSSCRKQSAKRPRASTRCASLSERPPPLSSSASMYQKLKVISATSASGCAAPRRRQAAKLTSHSGCCVRRRWRHCSPVSVKRRTSARATSSSPACTAASYRRPSASTGGMMPATSCACESASLLKWTSSTSISTPSSKSVWSSSAANASPTSGDAIRQSAGTDFALSQEAVQRRHAWTSGEEPRHCSCTCPRSATTCGPAPRSSPRNSSRRRGMTATLKFSASSGITVSSSSRQGSLASASAGGEVKRPMSSGTAWPHASMCSASVATARQSCVSTTCGPAL